MPSLCILIRNVPAKYTRKRIYTKNKCDKHIQYKCNSYDYSKLKAFSVYLVRTEPVWCPCKIHEKLIQLKLNSMII